MTLKYSLQVAWSDEDGSFIATIPELPGCMADGVTPAEAVNAAYEVAAEWIKTAKALNREIPQARNYESMDRQFRSPVQEQAYHPVEEPVATQT